MRRVETFKKRAVDNIFAPGSARAATIETQEQLQMLQAHGRGGEQGLGLGRTLSEYYWSGPGMKTIKNQNTFPNA